MASRTLKAAAERFIMEAIGEKPRSLAPGSIRLDGYVLDWTQRTPRGLVARTAYLHGNDLLQVVIAAAEEATDA